MRNEIYWSLLSFLVLFLLISLPCLTAATTPKQAAEADARSDINGVGWGAAGFCAGFSVLPVAVGMILIAGTQETEVSPPGTLDEFIACHFTALTGYCLYQTMVSFTNAPSPPPERLLGKPPEYVSAYTAAYKKKVLRIRSTYSNFGGCVGLFISFHARGLFVASCF